MQYLFRSMNVICLVGIIFIGAGFAQEKSIEQIMREEQEALKQIQQETLDYRDQVAEDMRLYQEQISREYEAYEAEQRRQLEEMEREILRKWEDFRTDTKEETVEYSADRNSRSSVNYKEGKIEVEVITDAKDPKASEKAQQEIQQKLKRIATQKVADNQLQTPSGKKVSPSNSDSFAKEVVKKQKIKAITYKSRDGKERIKYSIKLTLAPNHVQIRAKQFKDEVEKQSKRFKIDPAIAMAVMHAESYFNPKAKSHIPAYGLMQLVPKSGARDAYIYIYKKDRLLRANYLYQPPNNIELGCAYLSKNRYRYFGGIKDDEKAYLCTICAYNTGPGNVARALSGTTNLSKARAVANSHNTKWVHQKLQRDLPYKETKSYLLKVLKHRKMYQSRE